MFKLIKNTTKGELYYKAYVCKVEQMAKDAGGELDQTLIMSLVFLGTKAIIGTMGKDRPKDLDALIKKFKNAEAIKLIMSLLTPKQFINIFPIEKTYDGAKYECKDYFSTMEMVNSLDQDSPIGDKIDDFLWDYMNRDTRLFQVETMSLISDIMRANGEPGLMECMTADLGTPLYYSDSKDKSITGTITIENVDDEYYYNDTEAKTTPIKKPMPDYLKIYNGGLTGTGLKLH